MDINISGHLKDEIRGKGLIYFNICDLEKSPLINKNEFF